MAEREYRINLVIEGNAGGSAPVDAGLKRVEEGARRAEDALKKVEDQSRRTESAVSTGGGSPGAAFGVGSNGLPLPDKARSWHSPEEVAAIERMAGSMRTVTAEAATMEAATARAAAGMQSLGTGAIAAGASLTLVLGTVVAGALPELKEFGSALGDLAFRFARAASEATGLPQAVKGVTTAIKEYSGAASDERAEEQRAMNAKLDTALARQKVTMAAREEKAAINEVTAALEKERQELEMRQALDDERSKTGSAQEDAQFDLERAKLVNTPGLSREDRVTREADIERRQLEARQARQKADIERRLQDELEKVAVADRVLADAQERGDSAAIAKAQEAERRARNAASAARVRSKGDLERLEITGPIEIAAQQERSQASIISAREADAQEAGADLDDEVREYMKRTGEKNKDVARRKKAEEKAAAKEEAARVARMGRLVAGDGGESPAFPEEGNDIFNAASMGGVKALRGARKLKDAMGQGKLGQVGNEETAKLINDLEASARLLADGTASGDERRAFNDALAKLATAVSRISPAFSAGLRALRQDVEPRLQQIEADLATLHAGGTK